MFMFFDTLVVNNVLPRSHFLLRILTGDGAGVLRRRLSEPGLTERLLGLRAQNSIASSFQQLNLSVEECCCALEKLSAQSVSRGIFY